MMRIATTNQSPIIAVGFFLIVAAMLSTGMAAPKSADANDQAFARFVKPFIENHCIDCHDGATKKGKLNLDDMLFNLDDAANTDHWIKVFDKVSAGQMPPSDKERPPAKETHAAMSWLRDQLFRVSLERQTQQGPAVRRLNRVEYENTMHALLGIDIPLKEMLPEDGQSHGFDNVADGLSISSVLIEKYLDASNKALGRAIVHGYQPLKGTKNVLVKDLKKIQDHIKKKTYLVRDDAIVWFNMGYPQFTMHGFDTPGPGRYRFRVECWPYQPDGRSLGMAVYAGEFYRGDSFFLGYFDVAGTPKKPTVVEFEVTMRHRDTIRLFPYNVKSHEVGNGRNRVQPADYKGMGLAVRSIERTGPLETWPPASQKRLFGNLAFEKVDEGWPGGRRPKSPIFGVASKDPKADAKRVLTNFASRAFRRPVATDTLEPYLKLVYDRLANGYDFEKAMRVGFQAILCSPQFLTLNHAPKGLDDFAIASRLSYFLWSTMPDEQLIKLAAAGRLRDAKVLREQVERMLKDKRASALAKHFVGQWLDLRKIDETSPDGKLYPEFDHMLAWSMVRETEAFFETLLRDDLSVANFLHSDFITINERLAELYGIEGVKGFEFMRRVKVPADSHRGGVMTQASVLKVTANGTNTSPVLRGVWVMENIFGQPVPPAPESVPAVEPDIRGATTIREQLAKHRELGSCNSCHRLIDPPGFALESFDVIGGWRANYRSLGNGERIKKEVNGRGVQYRIGPAVDSTGKLSNGRAFKGIDELKQRLLEDKKLMARCMAEKLLVYGRGSGLSFADRIELDQLVDRVATKGDGLRTLIHAIVQSDAFLTR